MNQALQLLNSRDENYRFRTGAEVNKVCPCSPALILCASESESDLSVSLDAIADGCSDAPADASTKPPHNSSLHDAA